VVNGHWRPGIYLQDPQASGTIRPFDPGVYVFCNGLSGDVTANLGGTFFYFVGGGAYTCAPPPFPVSPNCQSNVQITPPTSGQYDGLAIWQDKSDNATIVMSKGLTNITGTVYAPSATANLKNGNININQLIAYAIDGNPGNPDVHIGPPLRVIVANQVPPFVLPPYTSGQPTWTGGQAVAVDGTGVYSNWSISGVPGLSISSAGVIGGMPSGSVLPGTYTVTVGVHDSDGEFATTPMSITINPALTISGSLPIWTIGQPGYPANPLTAGGGSGNGYAWTPVQIAPGLQMDATGTISGAPTQVGTFNLTITLTDSIGDVTTINPTVRIFPAVTVLSISSSNPNGSLKQNGQAEQGDTITLTFSNAIDPSSVCSTWNSGPNLIANKTTRVTLTRNPSGNDTLSVSDTGAGVCTFHIFSGGLLDLGQSGYVTTVGTPPKTAVFGNTSNCGGQHCSVVSIDATDTILTIILGDQTSGTVGATAGVPGITYTPDPAILGQGGAPVSGTATDTNKFF
jgi:hypothetical protein